MAERSGTEPETGDREIELTLLVAPDALEALAADPSVAAALAREPVRQVTTYYDTGDHAFLRRGFALRVREAKGRIVQTVKTHGTAAGAVTDRAEFDADLSSPDPDPSRIPHAGLRAMVEDQMAVKYLRSVFRTVVQRAKRVCTMPCGTAVEIAVDRGEIQAGPLRRPLCEVELELVEGNPRALLTLARALSTQAPVRLGVASKAARGYALREGTLPSPRKALAPVLPGKATTEKAMAAVFSECLAQIVANEPTVVEARDPVGVHQMRVGLRRLRAAISVFRQATGRAALSDLALQARTLAGLLGRVRDLDVVSSEILAPVLDHGESDLHLLRLGDRLAERREREWDALLAVFQDTSLVAQFALGLSDMIEARGWRTDAALPRLGRSARGFARGMLDKRAARVRAPADDLAGLDVEARHALRIEIKKLRYAVEFFGGLFDPQAAAAYGKRLARLQDLFGALNDMATAETLLPGLLEHSADPGLTHAVARVIEWHRKAATRDWKKVEARFTAWAQEPMFWAKKPTKA